MKKSLYSLANTGVQALQPYAPGKPMSELERELGLKNILKLASNENPLGCSVRVKEALAALKDEITLYPDGNGFALKAALLENFEQAGYLFSHKQVLLGNGSNDILELVARAFLNESTEAVFSEYAFAVYPIAVQAVGAKARVAPAVNWGHDLAAMKALVNEKTRVIFIANPNNPTGTWLKESEIRDFLKNIPETVIVVLDEAYFEYVEQSEYPNGLSLLSEHANLIVTRTFSKAYGLAGLRIGYAVADEALIDILNRVRQPFNVNNFALSAAEAALSDQAFIRQSIVTNTEGLRFLETELKKLQLDYIPSVANFISIDFASAETAKNLNQFLLENGLIVRPIAVYNMPTFLRVTVGSQTQNQRFVDLLKQFLAR